MKQFLDRLRILAVLLSFSSLLVIAPAAAAHNGESSDDSSNSGSGRPTLADPSSDSSDDNSTTPDSGDDVEETVPTTPVQTRVDKLLSEKRSANSGKKHTAEAIKKTCENQQNMINKKIIKFGTVAQKHLDAFDKIFTNLQAYQTDKQLDVTDYDALVADATAAQTTAKTAVDALKAASVTIDCTAPDPAGAIAKVQTAASDARVALQNYRKSLKKLAQAMVKAKAAANSTDDTSTKDGGTE